MHILILYLIVMLISFIGYLFLPFRMWAVYFGKGMDLIVTKLVFLPIIVFIAVFAFHVNMIPFCVGYIVSDPFIYYFMSYKK